MKRAILIVLAVVLALTVTGCNRGIFDIHQKFDSVILSMPDGSVVRGRVEEWWNYENSDMVQVKVDGVIYLTHARNVVLIRGEEGT